MTWLTEEKISDAILKDPYLNESNLEAVITGLYAPFQKSRWIDICKKVRPDCTDRRTFETYYKRCFYFFKRHFESIRRLTIEKYRIGTVGEANFPDVVLSKTATFSADPENSESAEIGMVWEINPADLVLSETAACSADPENSKSAEIGMDSEVNPSDVVACDTAPCSLTSEQFRPTEICLDYDSISENFHNNVKDVIPTASKQVTKKSKKPKKKNKVTTEKTNGMDGEVNPPDVIASDTAPCSPTSEDFCPTEIGLEYNSISDNIDDNDVQHIIPVASKQVAQKFENPMNKNKVRTTDKTKEDIYASWVKKNPLIIPKAFWDKYWNTGESLKDGWSDAFNKIFNVEYPYCVLACTWHKCSLSTRGGCGFQAVISCKHTTCTKYRFVVKEAIRSPHTDHAVEVLQEKSYDHSGGERHRRHVRGEFRESLAGLMEKMTPAALKNQQVNSTPDDVLAAGNLNTAPSRQILDKISSQNKCKYDLHKSFVTFMAKLDEHLTENVRGSVFDGYIQVFSVKPFAVMMCTEQQIRYMLSQKYRFLHLDATGSLVKCPNIINLHSQTIYNYALILRGGADFGPLVILDILLGFHDALTIGGLLKNFFGLVKKISPNKPVHKLETDFSLALLQASSWGANNMSLSQYMQVVYNTHENGPADAKVSLTVLHVCSSHLIKTVVRKAKKCFPNRKTQALERRIAGMFIGQLIHCDNSVSASTIYRKFVQIFGLPKKMEGFDDIIKDLASYDGSDDLLDADNDDDKTFPTDVDEHSGLLPDILITPPELAAATRKESPYFKLFKAVEQEELENSTNCTDEENEFYSLDFLKYVSEFLMPYFPLWSAICIKQFGLYRDSNAPIENYFKLLKHIRLKNAKKIAVPRFIMQNFEFVKGGLKEREYPLTTTRQAKKRSHTEDNPMEVWKRQNREPNRNNSYLKHKKFVEDTQEGQFTPEILALADAAGSPESEVFHDSETERLADEPSSTFQMLKLTSDQEFVEVPDEVPQEDCKTITVTVDEPVPENHLRHSLFSEHNTYPSGFPALTKNFNGYYLTEKEFRTLAEYKSMDEYLCDEVINSFFNLMGSEAEKNNMRLLVFDSMFCQSIYSNGGTVSEGMQKWAKKFKAWQADIWIVPVNCASHWTLLVVLPNDKMMIYFDSLRRRRGHDIDPIERIYDIFNGFLKFMNLSSDIRWEEWTLHLPYDVPSQVTIGSDGKEDVGGNCGVHISSWAYLIATGKMEPFSEADMNNARKAIASHINNARTRPKIQNANTQANILLLDTQKLNNVQAAEKPNQLIERSNQIPFGFDSTFEFCASLRIILETHRKPYATRRKI